MRWHPHVRFSLQNAPLRARSSEALPHGLEQPRADGRPRSGQPPSGCGLRPCLRAEAAPRPRLSASVGVKPTLAGAN